MKKILILLFILLTNNLYSQTPRSYIIPDIGAPGMNVYYEIIGVHDEKYKYGNEDFYLNNEGDALRVMPLNLEDTNKVSFGPIHVSWSGRMISGQIFIKPGLEPNSWDWSLLDNEWRIPIQIIKDGSPLPNEDHTFYIVQPFAFGNRSGFGERVLGQGQLGKRSPRGAMVVDEMILANDTYTVSKNNTDPDLPGNEGFLPFILLCVGDIQGQSNTAINVNAQNRDGGPGGGGGGGKWCDAFDGGNDGGSGFTGGGNGGNNYSDHHESGGTGSGSTHLRNFNNFHYGGASINGVKGGGVLTNYYESSSGGTGHPFGLSGIATSQICDDCPGGYGAGSGNGDLKVGGSGGNATSGVDENTTSGNGGNEHGNIYGVPIAGGSGGAGSNPKASLFSSCAGYGGGGGGAIRIFAKNITNLRVSANGADGQNGEPKGGAGSGGYVEIGTKENVSNVVLSAARGSNRAGYGRFRSDARNNAPSVVSENNLAQITTTIATDYVDFVDRNFNLSVKKNQNEVLDYYIRPEDGEWQKLFTFDDLTQTNEVFNIDLTQWQDTIFYGMAVQSTEYEGVESDYSHIPEKVLSQAAGNVFRVQEIRLICDQPRELDFSTCQPNSVYDTVWVKNIGTVNRTHVTFNPTDANKAYWEVNDGGFTVLEPTDIAYFDEEDSLKIRVRYNHQAGRTGVYSNTLTIPYGRNITDVEGEYQIEYKVDINNLNVDWFRENGDKIENDSLILEICVNEPFTESIRLLNNSAEKFTIKDIKFNGQEDDFSLSFLQDEVNPGEEYSFQIGVKENASEKNYFAKIYVEVDECEGIADSIFFIVNIKEAILEQENNSSIIDFGSVNTIQDRTLTRKFKNNGNTPAYIPNLPTITPNPPFELISANKAFPLTLDVGEEVEFEIRFSPPDPVSYSGTFSLIMEKTDLLCSQTATFNLIGNGVESNLLFPYELDWGILQWCSSEVYKNNVTIVNNSNNIDVTINGSHTITGANPENWEISNNIPQNGNIIPRNSGELTFDLRYKPEIGPDGPKSATLLIPTDDVSLPQNPNNPNQYLIEIELKAVKEGLNITVVPNSTLDYGEVPINEESQRLTVNITNNSTTFTRVLQVIEPSNYKMYNGVNQTFAPGENKDVDIVVTLDEVGVFNKDVNLIFDVSSGIGNCEATYTLQAQAFGIKGESEINPTELDFGYINKCQLDESLTFTIENIDQVPITLNNITLEGLDEQYFSLDNFTINDEIEQDEKITYTVNFNPPNPVTYGTFTANVIVDMTENNIDTTYNLPINVEISKGFSATPIILDFGNVVSTFPDVKDIILRNLHNWDITLDDLEQVPNEYPTFSFDDSDLDNKDITTPYYVPITFTPPAIGTYEDELVIPYTINGNCSETVTVILRGIGDPASALRIFIPDQIIDPTLEYVEIPIYTQITEGTTQIQSYNIESMTITMDKTTFHPISLSKGSISGIEYFNDELAITVSVNSVVTNGNETELTRIFANPLLGENQFSKINLSNAKVSVGGIFSSIDYDEADVELLICEEGGDRLLINNANIDLSFAITNSILKTEIEIVEAGSNKLEIISMDGRVIATEYWVRDIGGSNHYSYYFDLDKFATGLYLIRLITPNDIITKKIIINR